MMLKPKHIILPFAVCINIILAFYCIGIRLQLDKALKHINRMHSLKEINAKKINHHARSN